MGETGQGITEEDEILPGTKLTTKWGESCGLLSSLVCADLMWDSDLIKQESPWFFHLRALIGERPSRNAIGVGNNQTGFDTSMFLPAPTADDEHITADEDGTPGHGFDVDSGRDTSVNPSERSRARDNSLSAASDEEDGTDITKDRSHKRKVSETPSLPEAPPPKSSKRTAPRPGISVPAAQAKPTKRAKTTAERFAETVRADEEALRQGAELKRVRAEGKRDVRMARIRAQSGARASKDSTKLEVIKFKMEQESALALEKLRMQQEHEYRMAELSHSQARNDVLQTSPVFHQHASMAAGPSSTYSDGFSAASHSSASSTFEDWEPTPSAGGWDSTLVGSWNPNDFPDLPDFEVSDVVGGSSSSSS